jgi:hypothetical protein
MTSTITEDAGLYTVLASNRLGKAQTKAEIIVKCKGLF